MKKILSILIVLFGLFGISFGYSLLDNCSGIPNDGLSENTMYNEYTKCVEFDPGEDFIFRSNYTNSVSSNFNFTYYGVLDYKTLYTYGSYNGNGIHFMYWNSLGNLIGVSDTTYYNRVANFQINNFCFYGGSDYTGAYQKCANGLKIHNPCMNDNYNVSFSDFVSGVENHVLEKFYLMYFDYGYYIEEYGPILCGKYDNGFYCINNNFRQEYSNDLCSGITLLENNETSVGNGLTFYSSEFSNSPLSVGSSGGGGSNFTGSGVGGITYTSNTDYEKTLSYYEDRFGWNESMCYVGTNDLTSPYGTPGISFDNGTGGTIYSLFYSIYSGYGDNRIQNVGRFINTWLINYSQWFETVPTNRLYLASYSGPGNNVEYIYTGFTFPFANNPLAVYFMASNLQTNYSRESTQGEEMAYYCYLKLNEQVTSTGSNLGGDLSFDQVQDLINPNIVDRIDTYNNEVIGTGKVGFLVPNMSGSVWGDVVSGNVFSGDVDPSNIFDTFYDGIFSLVGNGNFSDGIIPLWIIYPMLFLILFRIMKH